MADWSYGDLVRYLAETFGVSIVAEEGLERKMITAEFVDVPIDQVIEVTAKRVGANVRIKSGVFYVGQLSREDRGLLVRRVRRLSQAELNSALSTVLGENGSVATFDDGLCVVADTVNVIDRVNMLIDSIETASSSGWVCQLQVISYGQRAVDDLGIDVVPAGQFAATVAGWPAAGGMGFTAELTAALSAVRDRSDVYSVADPVLVLGDGRTAHFDRVERVPFAQSVFETVGGSRVERQIVDFLDVGFQVSVALREISADEAIVELEVENSAITGTLPNLPPTIGRDKFDSVVPIRSGGLYLVGSFESVGESQNGGLGLRTSLARNVDRRVYQVWLRAYQINAGVRNTAVGSRDVGAATDEDVSGLGASGRGLLFPLANPEVVPADAAAAAADLPAIDQNAVIIEAPQVLNEQVWPSEPTLHEPNFEPIEPLTSGSNDFEPSPLEVKKDFPSFGGS